jgi:hypothetical protein
MWRIKLPKVLLFWNELDLDLHQGKVHVKMRQNQTNILITYQNISNGAQYVTLQKYFSHPSLVMYFFATPPIKPTANKWGTISSNPPGTIIMMGQSATLMDSQVLFITLSSAC